MAQTPLNLPGTASPYWQIGISGATMYQGTSVPSNIIGVPGDLYVYANGATSNLYQKQGSSWASLPGSGTVTSVAMSGGTTGLTTSGGPITTSGTITLSGTLNVANGGTGSTTTSGARTALGLSAASTLAQGNFINFENTTLNAVSDSVLGSLVACEVSSSNVILQSENFVSSTNWTGGAGTNSSVSVGSGINPDGSAVTYKLVESSSAGLHYLQSNSLFALNAGSAVYSCYVQAVERTKVCFDLINGAGALVASPLFNLGTKTATLGSATAAGIIPVANGWYRCWATITTGAGSSGAMAIHLANPSDGTRSSYTGDGASGVLIWGAQVESGAYPSSYIKTIGSFAVRPGGVNRKALPATLSYTDTVQAFTAAMGFSEVAITDAATIAWNLDTSQCAYLLATSGIGASRTISNPTNMRAGFNYTLRFKQDSAGSRTITWGSAFKWSGGTAPTLSTGADKVDILRFYCDGTNMLNTGTSLDVR